VRDFDTQFKVFQELTIAATVLDNPAIAFAEIDRVLDLALRYKRPVYIELPRDQVDQLGDPNYQWQSQTDTSAPEALATALEKAIHLIKAAQQPVILADVEIHRFGLQDALLRLTEKTNIPVAETLLGKSVMNELHPNYLGLYAGALGSEEARRYVESSDCLILLGVFLMDLNLGVFTANLDPNRAIYVTSEKTLIHTQEYPNIRLQDFVAGLIQSDIPLRKVQFSPAYKPPPPFSPIPDQAITAKRLFAQINTFLSAETIVIADVGDSLFGAIDLFVHDKTRFLSPAYYASLGFAVPAGIGVQLANPQTRPLILVGDGAFQMTGVELSTIARYQLNPIVIVLNNGGYATERPMLDGKFNNIRAWQNSRITELINAGRRFDVHTEGELAEALQQSKTHTECFCILDVHLDPYDMSEPLQRLTRELGKLV
jgi:indolepyruvate decarboxylase